jgi:hypothetical protein
MRNLIISVLAAASLLGVVSAANATTVYYDPDTGELTKACTWYYDSVWNEYHRRCWTP